MNPFLGPQYLLKGFRLIFKPGLRRFFFIPLLVNVVVFAGLIYLSYGGFETLLNWMLPAGDSTWLSIARSVLWVIFAATALFIVFFTFTVVANLIGAPFNGILSERVETYLTGEKVDNGGGFKAVMAAIGPTLRSEIRKLFYFIVLAAFVFLFSLIPVINIVSPVLWFLFGAWMLSLEYLSYPMENHGLFFKEVRSRLGQKRLLSFTFGIAVLAVTLIPVVNFFVMPSAVAGATVLWVENWPPSGPGPGAPGKGKA